MNTENKIAGQSTLRALLLIIVCVAPLPAMCQSKPKYQVGTITAVERTRDSDNGLTAIPSYNVPIQIERTIYVVRYTPSDGLNTVQYTGGREVVVLVGEHTITYNDMLGEPRNLPIITQKAATPRKTDK